MRRHRRFHQPTLNALEILEGGSPAELVRAFIARAEPVELRELLQRVEIVAKEVTLLPDAVAVVIGQHEDGLMRP